MALTKKAGTELATGIDTISGLVAQDGDLAAGGELKVYKSENGSTMSIYLDDDHKEVSFEGLLKSTDVTAAKSKKIGDSFTALGVSGYLTAWKVHWQCDDVAKVSGSLRDYDIASSGGSGSGTGGGTQG